MIDNNKISHIIISQKLFPAMMKNPDSPNKIAKTKGWLQEENKALIESYVKKVIEKYPDKVKEYQNGNINLLGLFMGEIMRESKGKLDPKSVNETLKSKLMK